MKTAINKSNTVSMGYKQKWNYHMHKIYLHTVILLMTQFTNHNLDFHEICNWKILQWTVKPLQFSCLYNNFKNHFTWTSTCVSVHTLQNVYQSGKGVAHSCEEKQNTYFMSPISLLQFPIWLNKSDVIYTFSTFYVQQPYWSPEHTQNMDYLCFWIIHEPLPPH
jgi:hypothetical protein